jgi:hypothetical protein
MKKMFFILVFLAISASCFSQEIEYKEYSYSEFFQLIAQEQDSIFKLENALIKFNPSTDEQFNWLLDLENETIDTGEKQIIVNKALELDNVQFLMNINQTKNQVFFEGTLTNIQFNKDVTLNNIASLTIFNCQFKSNFSCDMTMNPRLQEDMLRTGLYIWNSEFNDARLFIKEEIGLNIRSNSFISHKEGVPHYFRADGFASGQFINNYFESKGGIWIHFYRGSSNLYFSNNKINVDHTSFTFQGIQNDVFIKDNQFSSKVHLSTDLLDKNDDIDWGQFKNQTFSGKAFNEFSREYKGSMTMFNRFDSLERGKISMLYEDSVRYFDKNVFVEEIALKGMFHDYYKSKYNTESANEVYIELKDFETKRLEVLYQQNPTFRTYFKWKVNQFLKVFSDYGTEPSKAIVFSMYVIIAFALIYLFFPNSWDAHGKNRIVDRYRFFFKYLQRNAGIHEVYLEEKRQDLLDYEEFKSIIMDSEKSVPRFFAATALPLYQWAVSGTRSEAPKS